MNEKVLAIKRSMLPAHWMVEKIALKLNLEEIPDFTGMYEWHERNSAETNESIKQIIPYIVIKHKSTGKYLTYMRNGNENRLHGLSSVGVGGHINPVDSEENFSFIDIIIASLRRELHEEIHCYEKYPNIEFVGIVNEELTKTGRTHIGIVYQLTVNEKVKGKEELFNTHWTDKIELLNNYKLELWSEMALELVK